MPNVKLPTGVDLYYEAHGQVEPLVLIPSTAFSAEVWKPYQVPGLSKSLNLSRTTQGLRSLDGEARSLHDRSGSNHLAQAEVLAKRIPGAELKILKGQSHGFFWQAPEETNGLILSWIKKHNGEK